LRKNKEVMDKESIRRVVEGGGLENLIGDI
jgi:hypothetical protein